MPEQTGYTLLGIPVYVDRDMPENRIVLSSLTRERLAHKMNVVSMDISPSPLGDREQTGNVRESVQHNLAPTDNGEQRPVIVSSLREALPEIMQMRVTNAHDAVARDHPSLAEQVIVALDRLLSHRDREIEALKAEDERRRQVYIGFENEIAQLTTDKERLEKVLGLMFGHMEAGAYEMAWRDLNAYMDKKSDAATHSSAEGQHG